MLPAPDPNPGTTKRAPPFWQNSCSLLRQLRPPPTHSHPQISPLDADSRNRSVLTTDRADYTESKPPHSVHSVHSVVKSPIENLSTTNDDSHRLNINQPDRKSAQIRAICGFLSLVCLCFPFNPVTTKRAPPAWRRRLWLPTSALLLLPSVPPPPMPFFRFVSVTSVVKPGSWCDCRESVGKH